LSTILTHYPIVLFATGMFSFLGDRWKNGSPYAIGPLSVSCLSVYNVRALWPKGWMDQDETWHAGRPRPWPHCVRCHDSILWSL